MEKLIIHGGKHLEGKVRISGSKNSSLPILFATILCNDAVTLFNIPNLRDINTTLELLSTLGLSITSDEKQIIINVNQLKSEAPYDLVKTMRASVLCLGPLLARLGKARVALPGGCAIGTRPVDQHLKAFEQMGAKFKLEDGYIIATCDKLMGAHITFDMPTVGGTENLLMAACLADGETVLENVAREPEIIDLANFLISCGAEIKGQGQNIIYVKGKKTLSGTKFHVMPDRIEAGTFMIAAAITRGCLELENCPLNAMDSIVNKLKIMGLNINLSDNGNVICEIYKRTTSTDLITQPYPGFPTDMQAQIMSLLCLSSGSGMVTETIFENRFMHVQELLRMGAKIMISGRNAIIKGVSEFSGAPVMASDLRASASLVLAGLAANGITKIDRIYHLDRGYESIEKKLNAVGAEIRRIDN